VNFKFHKWWIAISGLLKRFYALKAREALFPLAITITGGTTGKVKNGGEGR